MPMVIRGSSFSTTRARFCRGCRRNSVARLQTPDRCHFVLGHPPSAGLSWQLRPGAANIVTVLKVELHCHTDIDPLDRIPYSTRALIDYAARLKFDAIAITAHDKYFDPSVDADYARVRKVTLIAGIERTIQGKHVLLLNFPEECA